MPKRAGNSAVSAGLEAVAEVPLKLSCGAGAPARVVLKEVFKELNEVLHPGCKEHLHPTPRLKKMQIPHA